MNQPDIAEKQKHLKIERGQISVAASPLAYEASKILSHTTSYIFFVVRY